MPDWPEYVRRNLRLRGFRPGARSRNRRRSGAPDGGRLRRSAAHGRERSAGGRNRAAAHQRLEALANALAEAHRGKEPIMTAWQQHTEDRDFANAENSRFTGWRRDVLYGLRLLAKNPGFAAVAVLTLALCIGANTAIFSVINAVMFKALPVRDPNHLMLLEWSARGKPETPRPQLVRRLRQPAQGRQPARLLVIQTVPRRSARARPVFKPGGIRGWRRDDGERHRRGSSRQPTVCFGRLFSSAGRGSGAGTRAYARG